MSSTNTNPVFSLIGRTTGAIGYLAPLLDLGLRLWVANVFWKSGLQKTQTL